MLQVYCVGWENDRETNHKTSDRIQEAWVCSLKGWRGRAESPLLASAEAKPSATSKALPHNSSAALAMPFLPSASCRNLDLPPVNLRFLQSHLTKMHSPSHQLICAVLPKTQVWRRKSIRISLPKRECVDIEDPLGGEPQCRNHRQTRERKRHERVNAAIHALRPRCRLAVL